MDSPGITLQVLLQIRDELRDLKLQAVETNKRLDQTNRRIDQTHRQLLSTEARLATEIALRHERDIDVAKR